MRRDYATSTMAALQVLEIMTFLISNLIVLYMNNPVLKCVQQKLLFKKTHIYTVYKLHHNLCNNMVQDQVKMQRTFKEEELNYTLTVSR